MFVFFSIIIIIIIIIIIASISSTHRPLKWTEVCLKYFDSVKNCFMGNTGYQLMQHSLPSFIITWHFKEGNKIVLVT